MRNRQLGMPPLDYIIANPFAWPGGYEIFAIMEDGETLCNKCCEKEQHIIRETHKGSGWNILGLSHTGEDDGFLTCCHCERVIQEGFDVEDNL